MSGVVLVIGSLNEDVVLRVARVPRPGETLAAEQVSRRAGGKGANQAVAAARAGAMVRMLGRVGSDPAGGRMLDDLRGEGVDTSAVQILPDVATGTAYITVTPDGENTIVLDPGANARLSAEDVVRGRDCLTGAAVMLAQLEVPVATVTAAVRLASDAGVRPVVTLAPVQRVPAELLAGLDPLLVNELEAAALLGGESMDSGIDVAAERLLDLGARSAVITLGGRGAVLADATGVTRVAAHPVAQIIDTTGAGDAFAGSLAAALATGASLADAVQAGMHAGAAAVGRAGAR